jgi:hypothetical protein
MSSVAASRNEQGWGGASPAKGGPEVRFCWSWTSPPRRASRPRAAGPFRGFARKWLRHFTLVLARY